MPSVWGFVIGIGLFALLSAAVALITKWLKRIGLFGPTDDSLFGRIIVATFIAIIVTGIILGLSYFGDEIIRSLSSLPIG